MKHTKLWYQIVVQKFDDNTLLFTKKYEQSTVPTEDDMQKALREFNDNFKHLHNYKTHIWVDKQCKIRKWYE